MFQHSSFKPPSLSLFSSGEYSWTFAPYFNKFPFYWSVIKCMTVLHLPCKTWLNKPHQWLSLEKVKEFTKPGTDHQLVSSPWFFSMHHHGDECNLVAPTSHGEWFLDSQTREPLLKHGTQSIPNQKEDQEAFLVVQNDNLCPGWRQWYRAFKVLAFLSFQKVWPWRRQV